MSADPVAVRYAQALLEAAQAQDTLRQTAQRMAQLREALEAVPAVSQVLEHPGIASEEKQALLERAVPGPWPEGLRAFARLVVAFGRAEQLLEIARAFGDAVEAAEGRMRVTVRSARVLPAPLLERLRRRLEQREGRQVSVQTDVAPELLGGVQILLEQRIIDGSVQRQLADLRRQLKQVRVH